MSRYVFSDDDPTHAYDPVTDRTLDILDAHVWIEHLYPGPAHCHVVYENSRLTFFPVHHVDIPAQGFVCRVLIAPTTVDGGTVWERPSVVAIKPPHANDYVSCLRSKLF